mmetsp:Transcript_32367/g.102932  ORF Transcript_32367/g.102932 Transcript_32367/m.102932 type:complete len:216 (+) Transcript_32367:445-1092(+)
MARARRMPERWMRTDAPHPAGNSMFSKDVAEGSRASATVRGKIFSPPPSLLWRKCRRDLLFPSLSIRCISFSVSKVTYAPTVCNGGWSANSPPDPRSSPPSPGKMRSRSPDTRSLAARNFLMVFWRSPSTDSSSEVPLPLTKMRFSTARIVSLSSSLAFSRASALGSSSGSPSSMILIKSVISRSFSRYHSSHSGCTFRCPPRAPVASFSAPSPG